MDREIDADGNTASAERIWAEFLVLVSELPAPLRVHFLLRLLRISSVAEIVHWMDQGTSNWQGTIDRAPREFRAVQTSWGNGGHS